MHRGSRTQFYLAPLLALLLLARRPMSTHSSSDEHSDTHSSHGSDYTNPSSVASVGDDDEHSQHSQEQTKGFVQGLLKEKKEHEILLKAWAERCRTLEEEVGRLARLVQSMELDRSSAVATQVNCVSFLLLSIS